VGPDGSVGTATRYGLGGPEIESRWGRDFPHPMGIGSFPGEKRPDHGVDHLPQLTSRSTRKSKAKPLLPPWALMAELYLYNTSPYLGQRLTVGHRDIVSGQIYKNNHLNVDISTFTTDHTSYPVVCSSSARTSHWASSHLYTTVMPKHTTWFKVRYFWLSLTKIGKRRTIFVQIPNTKFHKNPSSSTWNLPCGRTDRHT